MCLAQAYNLSPLMAILSSSLVTRAPSFSWDHYGNQCPFSFMASYSHAPTSPSLRCGPEHCVDSGSIMCFPGQQPEKWMHRDFIGRYHPRAAGVRKRDSGRRDRDASLSCSKLPRETCQFPRSSGTPLQRNSPSGGEGEGNQCICQHPVSNLLFFNF